MDAYYNFNNGKIGTGLDMGRHMNIKMLWGRFVKGRTIMVNRHA